MRTDEEFTEDVVRAFIWAIVIGVSAALLWFHLLGDFGAMWGGIMIGALLKR